MLHQRLRPTPISALPVLLLLGTSLAIPAAPSWAEAAPSFRLETALAGAHRIRWDDLHQAGLEDPVPSAGLTLTHLGESVPTWVNDGGDGLFGPGDHFEFIAEILHGEHSFYHDHSSVNIYWLELTPTAGLSPVRMVSPTLPRATDSEPGKGAWRERHFEKDALLIRLKGGANAEPEEPWYWQKMTHLFQPFKLGLHLPDLDRTVGNQAVLRVHARALSRGAQRWPDLRDHRLEVVLNNSMVGHAEWDGETSYLLEIPDLNVFWLRDIETELRLRLPQRNAPESEDPIVDVVMLNWIELGYPANGFVGPEQIELRVDRSTNPSLGLEAAAERLVVFGDDGSRAELVASGENVEPGETRRFEAPLDGAQTLTIVPDDAFFHVERIVADQPSSLRAEGRQADYLMIAHHRLLEEVEPLAELHRRRGLTVTTVDVQDVYDEFNHGILDPSAIRDFISHAYHNWTPAPRFVLLVGDASWDPKNAEADDANYANWSTRQFVQGRDRFAAREASLYTRDAQRNHRNLIPTWNYNSFEGHAASDNWFVSVDGDDYFPDLAIGRFPVIEPEEVRAIVAKTSRYIENPELGPWRRNILWITNDEPSFQMRTENLVNATSKVGFEPIRVYPKPEETDNSHHQARLREAFDAGSSLVHFFGHGGRYIWRTGPVDLKKNHDLFTLEDLDRLKPNSRLPIVLSMTCFTAPFDHPNADSLGEKFVRLPDRGAVAVFGASWRNAPSSHFSSALVAELTQPGSLGEAIVRAKQVTPSRVLVETYNLIGDPAIPVAVPQTRLDLVALREGEHIVAVDATLPMEDLPDPAKREGRFRGRAVVDWLGEGREVLATEEIEIDGPNLQIRFDQEAATLSASAKALRVYMWDTELGVDGVGHMILPDAALPQVRQPDESGGEAAQTSDR